MAMVRAMVSCTLSSMPPPSSTRLSTTAAMMRQGIDMGPTAPCLDCPKMLYTIGGKMTCPHDRWQSWKNATQMPAIIVRLTVKTPYRGSTPTSDA